MSTGIIAAKALAPSLLNYAIDFAKKKNFLRITLLTDKPNERLKRFFLKNGFVESNMIPMRMYFREK